MVQLTRPRPRDERGAVALMVAILAILMFSFAALVMDLGQAKSERRGAQSAADAAALAGGNALYAAGSYTPNYAAATTAVKAYALKNYGVSDPEWASCSDSGRLGTTAAGTQCISYEVNATGAKVRVMMPNRTVTTGFARVLGINSINVSAHARAKLKVGGASDCGLCVLGSGATHDIQNGDVTVAGGNVHFNGNVDVGPNGLVATGGTITVEGTADGPLSNYVPDPTTGQPAITDPFADFLDKPTSYGTPKTVAPCVGGPGIYGDYTLTGNSQTCTLPAGLYVIVGDWSIGGNSNVIAGNGVTLFFTCGTTTNVVPCASSGQDGGSINMGGSGSLKITAPTSGETDGMALWFDRNNTAEAHLHGNGLGDFSGTIYGKSIELRMSGNACGSTDLDALVVVGDLRFDGTNACLMIDYNAANNTDVPPGQLHLDQ